MKTWACDFETINDPNDCRIWSWGACEIKSEDYCCGTDMQCFFAWLENQGNIKLVFHNARFDFSFIEYPLYERYNMEWTDARKLLPGQYTTLINHMGVFYNARLCMPWGQQINIVDSAKILMCKLADFPKMFGWNDISKGEIDYDKYRPVGYAPTVSEREYQKSDCLLLARGYRELRQMGYNKLTLASNSMMFFKLNLTDRIFRQLFPVLDKKIDAFIRAAYNGGLCVVNPKYRGKIVGEGRVYDVNSEYPYHNAYSPLPYGIPVHFTGMYRYNPSYPLFIQRVMVDCRLLPGHIECIIIKTHRRGKNEYLTDTHGELLELTLTSVDLAILLENYYIYDIEYVEGYMFRQSTCIFTDYFEQIFTQKEQATIDGNMALRTDAKLRMNSLGGKFGTNPITRRKKPYYDTETKMIRYEELVEEKNSVYCGVIAYVTAYGRLQLLTGILNNIKRFLYCDTDSLHFLGRETAFGLDVHKTRIGAWDAESEFDCAIYVRQKTYCEWDLVNNVSHVKCAGLPNAGDYAEVPLGAFKSGFTARARKQKRVPGGVVLVDYDFVLK